MKKSTQSKEYKPTVTTLFKSGKLVHFPKHPIYGDGTSEEYTWPCGCKGVRSFIDTETVIAFVHCRNHSGIPEGLPESTFTTQVEPKIGNPTTMFFRGGLVHFGKKRLIPEEVKPEVIEQYTWPCGCKGGREFTKLAEHVHKTDGKLFFDPCHKHEHKGCPEGNVSLTIHDCC